ncbi:hypothetical protein F5X68DRAFT_229045 [Plectosphaerella plurivora]|uniref:DUF7872 domain-containing protein n=1 Tax=Plectosphaerella plurivora TaxID=936078 RepID=A0A9P8VID4_9PEZI|nr:hypothetical protein F5X68DRAFT_229045 [Plectosphaerella plurivora]
MRFQSLLLTCAVSSVLASPLPQATGNDECKTEALNLDTWQKLGIEDYLTEWTTYNLSKVDSNAVQNLAASFGAPNFFCGLDSFCNAGQPCSPVKLPQWYALVAIQNWNSYMNQLYTALIATSNILSLKLPTIVSDLNPKPRDDITPLKTMTRVFAGALSIIPFTGAVSTAAGVISSTSSFISTNLQAPTPPDDFLQWSNIANSMGTMVQAWQGSLSDSIQNTIDAQANVTGGIYQIVRDGKFLGAHRNVTQAELQDNILRSMELYTIGLILQSRGVFLYKSRPISDNQCKEYGSHYLCVDEGNGVQRQYILLKRDKEDNATSQSDLVDKLVDTYKLTREQILRDPAECFTEVKNEQGAYPFGDVLPVDPTTKCIFNLNVCESDNSGANKGIVKMCRDLGVGVDAGGPQ